MYLKDKPCGEDLFNSSAHDKIASAIGKVIKNDNLDIDIIGLEGDWGSGKSNVIKIIGKNLESSHHFFVYDAWGHQEDLQRRSFLEELTQELCSESLLEDNSKWREKLENLLARKTKKTTKTVPKLNMKLFYLFLALFLNSIFRSINFTEIITMTNPITREYSIFDNIMKEGLLILLRNIPVIVFLMCFLFTSFIKSLRDKSDGFIKVFKSEINLLLQIYRKEELENTVETITSTKEPSVREFKKWMNELSYELTKNIVIVFDNMDRLPQQKAKDLWASIHTFFSENDYDKINVIVPFDRGQIRKIFSDNKSDEKIKRKNNEADRFIDKTFELVYRVTPPVISDWKSYFKLKFDELELNCQQGDLVIVRNLFDTKHDYIKPREIILFLNELNLYYSIWKEVIPLQYIALFLLSKDKLLVNPLKSIINQEYLEGINQLFDEEHQKYISALVFNVEPEKASQVLLSREIDKAVANEDIEQFLLLSKAFAFDSIFEKKMTEVDGDINGNLKEFIVVIYKAFFDKDKINLMFSSYNRVLYRAFFDSSIIGYELQKYIQYLILMNLDSANKILEYYLSSYEVNGNIRGDEYFNNIVTIEEFIKENNITFELKEKIPPVTLDLDEMYSYLRVSKLNDSVYKIKTDVSALSDELVSMINQNEYDLEKIQLLRYMPDNLNKLDNVKSLMKEKIQNNKIPYNGLEGAYKIIFAFREPSKSYLLDTRFISQILYSQYQVNEEYSYILIAMLITQMEDTNYNNQIHQSHRSNINKLLAIDSDKIKIEGICSYIREFIDIGSLFKIISKYNRPLLNNVAKKLMTKPSNSLNISEVLQKYDSINSKLGIQNSEFIEFLDQWHSDLSSSLKDTNIFDVLKSEEFIMECFSNEYNLSIILVEISLDFFDKMKYKYFEDMFINNLNSSAFTCFYELVKQGYLTTFTNDMNIAFRTVLEDNIENSSINERLKFVIDKIYEEIDKNSLREVFRNIRNRLISKLKVLEIDINFYIPLIMRHSRLHDKPDESINKIIIPILKEDPSILMNVEFSSKIVMIGNKASSEGIPLKEILYSIDQKNIADQIEVDDIRSTDNIKESEEVN